MACSRTARAATRSCAGTSRLGTTTRCTATSSTSAKTAQARASIFLLTARPAKAFRGTYITSHLGEFYQARKTHNIQSVIYFELDSGNNTWGVVNNGVALNPPHSAFAAFTAANP